MYDWCNHEKILLASLVERGTSRQHRLLQRDLSREDGVETATGIMVERKLNLEKGYRKALAKAFKTHPHQVDFTKPDQAVSIINSWVLDHTAGIHTTLLTLCWNSVPTNFIWPTFIASFTKITFNPFIFF